jgi:hypothetical protein
MTPFTTLGELSPFPFVSGTLLYWHANALLPLLRLHVVTKFISLAGATPKLGIAGAIRLGAL